MPFAELVHDRIDRKSSGGAFAPVLDGTSGDQRFHLGRAQIWRRKYRKPNLVQRLVTDPHAPPRQRTAFVRKMDP